MTQADRLETVQEQGQEQGQERGSRSASTAPATAAEVSPPQVSVEAEVIDNILRQPIGQRSVADLALPNPFLERVADRIIRKSYVERYRIVVHDDAQHASEAVAPRAPAARPVTTWIACSIGAALLAVVVWTTWRRRGAAR